MNTYVIYKYEVLPAFDLLLPVDAKPLSVQLQGRTPQMWILQDRAAEAFEPRYFAYFGTGHPIPAERLKQFIGTFQQDGFVWHLFEVSNG